MQRKGFTKEEIKERLLQVGWSQSSIDKYLREEVLSGKFVEKKAAKQFKHSLNMVNSFLQMRLLNQRIHIGWYSLLITNKRLLVLEKFPKNISEYYFNDLELVEFYTTIQSLSIIRSALLNRCNCF